MHSSFVEKIGKIGELMELPKNEQDHLFKTLRASVGDDVRLLDGRGTVAMAKVVADRQLEIFEREVVAKPKLRIHLACAAPRRQKLDVLLKQLAEVGVWQIDLISCKRSVAKPEGKERWQTLLQEGCKQSGNPFLPKIRANNTLKDRLDAWRIEGVVPCYGAISEDKSGLIMPDRGDIGFLVGPEGGFSDEELGLMADYGVIPINLGPWILRLETAALCGVTALRILSR